MDTKRWTAHAAAATAALVLLVGCADGTGVSGPAQVSLNFRVAGSGGPAAAPALVGGGPALTDGPLPHIHVTGTNGTLTLDSLFIIINEVELKRDDPSCDSVEVSGFDCGEFEAGPRFLKLPLDGQPIEAVTALIPPGNYKELDFEVEDLEDDEGDPTEAALIAALRAEILAEIPDWPRKASAVVMGSFAPSAGGSIDFRVFLEAEIEIEFELLPRLVIDDQGAASRDITVDVSPDIWFRNPDGSVKELQVWDYDATGQLLEFEVEMEDGFTEIEFDD